jgi:hypothetical protein
VYFESNRRKLRPKPIHEIDPRAANANGCVPWNFPSADDDMPPCKPIERHNFLQAFRTAETNNFVAGGMARYQSDQGSML